MEESNSGSGDPSDRLTLSGDAGMKRTGSAAALPRQINPIAMARRDLIDVDGSMGSVDVDGVMSMVDGVSSIRFNQELF